VTYWNFRQGWFGLAAAKTYIELHPSESLVVVDAASTLGGVWAEHRLYPGLKSNNMLGTYEYPDMPMSSETYGVQKGQHIPGPVLHRYLTDYAKKFGVFGRIRLNTKVHSAEPTEEGGWILKTSSSGSPTLKTKKLVLATGLTSQPYIPDIPGKGKFDAPLFHARDFRANANTLKEAKNAVVLGGAKSAWDVAYAYAEAGVHVDMIIRKSGHGPVWMAPPYVTPLKKWLEKLVHTRFLTWFSPCVWGDEDGYTGMRGWLHGSTLGRFIVNGFWNVLGNDVITLNKYDSHPELKKLKPWDPAFYIGSSLSIHNYPTSFFDLVREGKVRVHIDEITKLEPKEIQLESGEVLKADVLVCATGWKKEPALNFTDSTENLIGLHHTLPELEALTEKADAVILKRFPRLKTQPERKEQLEKSVAERANHPLRLYRFMVPPAMVAQRNLAFAGMLTTITTAICATTQALWISAFFDGKLDRLPPSEEELRWQTVLHSQYGKWRYPIGYGPRYPDFVFDAVPYVDMLLKDLNVESHRKNGMMADISDPYGPEDYVGLIDEWRSQHEKTKQE